MPDFDAEILELKSDQPVPYELLLLADPSRQLIDEYLKSGKCFVAVTSEKIVGVMVLTNVDQHNLEIKNIAVAEAYQGKGIGKQLIEYATIYATSKGYSTLRIGTGNSSIDQLALYQKQGFEITNIIKDFFLTNYTELIFENGIQCKHMIVLTKTL